MSEAPEDWDEERPALPVEIPFEKEVAGISAAALTEMQASCHDASLVSLPVKPRRGRPKKKTEPNTSTIAAKAAVRLWKILMACHEEKWRRQRESPCYAAIATAPLDSLGRSTIELLRQGTSLPEAVSIAVTQIECDAYRRLWVSLGGTHGEGVEWFLHEQEQHEQHYETLSKIPKGEWQQGMSFEDGLEALFPLESRKRPGRTDYRGTRRRREQRKRFKDLLIGFVLGEHPRVLAAEEGRNRPEKERLEHLMNDKIKVGDPVSEKKKIEPLSRNERLALLSKEEQKGIVIAGKRLRTMERTGIPRELFRAAKLWVTTRAKGGAHEGIG
jgi:hypothetical protein